MLHGQGKTVSSNRYTNAVVTATIRLRFDGCSTTVRLLLSKVMLRNPLAAVTLTCLLFPAS